MSIYNKPWCNNMGIKKPGFFRERKKACPEIAFNDSKRMKKKD